MNRNTTRIPQLPLPIIPTSRWPRPFTLLMSRWSPLRPVYASTTRQPTGVPAYLRDVAFPATKQDLLRAARANSDDPMALRRVEQLPDRSYTSLSEVTSALLATV